MENKIEKLTLFGQYFKKIGGKPSKVGALADINPKNISLLSTNVTRIIYSEEFYKIIYAAQKLAKLDDQEFTVAVNEIFPKRPKVDLLDEYKDYSPEAKFYKKHTLSQSDIEEKIGIANGKISKYFGDINKKSLAIEMICFIEGLGLDVLKTFKEIYGEVNIVKDQADLNDKEH
ncbi:hypothetical protein ACR780_21475 [Sphingobacterium faecium]|uniref:hypothetical protein n=1 Tax=Sphingobacterium faecium TaxID=34087 RepID=UPI003DA2451F